MLFLLFVQVQSLLHYHLQHSQTRQFLYCVLHPYKYMYMYIQLLDGEDHDGHDGVDVDIAIEYLALLTMDKDTLPSLFPYLPGYTLIPVDFLYLLVEVECQSLSLWVTEEQPETVNADYIPELSLESHLYFLSRLAIDKLQG